MPPYRRPLSPVERTWLVADRLRPPFVNQLVIEGRGTLDAARWGRALAEAAEAQPGVAVGLRGWLWTTRWQGTGVAPVVREVDGAAWSGRGPDGAPFLAEPLDPVRGPVTELLLVHGEPPRIVLRTHHAALDGRGTLLLLDGILARLAGQPAPPVHGATTDLALARSLGVEAPRLPPEDCLAPTGCTSGEEEGTTWRRVSVEGRFSGLLPAVVLELGRAARSWGEEGAVRVQVSVDLRPAVQAPPSNANLSGILALELGPGDGPQEVAAALSQALAEHRAAGFVVGQAPLSALPLWLMEAVARHSSAAVQRRSRYSATATVSNLGRLPVERWSGAGFQAERAWFVPPGTDSHACFLVLAGNPGGLELIASVPRNLANAGRLDALMERLAAAARAQSAQVPGIPS